TPAGHRRDSRGPSSPQRWLRNGQYGGDFAHRWLALLVKANRSGFMRQTDVPEPRRTGAGYSRTVEPGFPDSAPLPVPRPELPRPAQIAGGHRRALENEHTAASNGEQSAASNGEQSDRRSRTRVD